MDIIVIITVFKFYFLIKKYGVTSGGLWIL